MSDNQKYLNELKSELDTYGEKLSQIQNRFKGKTAGETQEIYDSLKSILHEAKTAYSQLKSASADEWKPLKKISTESFHTLKKSFSEALNDSSKEAKESIKDYAHQIESFSEEQIEYAGEYIRNNPFTSVLVAAGLGYVIGKIFK